MPNILLLTLARAGSKGIPHKNMVMCAGKPLIQWTIEEAVKLPYPYMVVSDIPDLAGLSFCQVEPPQMAEATSDEALRWAVVEKEAICHTAFDYIVELMATNPLKTAEDIQACIDLLLSSGADSVIAVTKLESCHPARAKRLVDGRLVDWCEHCRENSTQRQELEPPAYIRASAIYALTREALFTVGRFGHEHSLAYVLPPERGVGIDTMADLKAAEWYLEQRSENG